MPLFWIVHSIDGTPRVFIGEGSALIHARLRASMAGHAGEFVEAHELDAKTTKKIPQAMIGRTLSSAEATALLDRIGS